jgi:hypothetical protein
MQKSNAPFIKFVSQGLLTAVVGIIGAAVLATMPVPALSATTGSATGSATATPAARGQYARDLAHCRSLTARSTERANCLSEASTRYHMTQPTKATELPDVLARNALMRCEPLPLAQKTECIARIQHGSISGSVAGGGVLRSLTTREVVAEPGDLPPTSAGAAVPAMPASGAPVPPAASSSVPTSPPAPLQPGG